MTMWMSRSAGTFASTRSRNLRNSRARWRGKHLPMISPVAMSRAGQREVVPWRCVVVAAPLRLPGAHRQEGLGGPRPGSALFSSFTENHGHDPAAPNTDDRCRGPDSTKKGRSQLEGLRAMLPASRRPATCDEWSRARGQLAAPSSEGSNGSASGGVSSSVSRTASAMPIIADLTRRDPGRGSSYRPSRPLRRIAAIAIAHGVGSPRDERRSPCSPTLTPPPRRSSPPRKPLRRLATRDSATNSARSSSLKDDRQPPL